MSAYINNEGYARMMRVCKCGGELSHIHVPFPITRAYVCKKCGEFKTENLEFVESVMKQLVVQLGAPPSAIMFDRGISGAVGINE